MYYILEFSGTHIRPVMDNTWIVIFWLVFAVFVQNGHHDCVYIWLLWYLLSSNMILKWRLLSVYTEHRITLLYCTATLESVTRSSVKPSRDQSVPSLHTLSYTHVQIHSNYTYGLYYVLMLWWPNQALTSRQHWLSCLNGAISIHRVRHYHAIVKKNI